MHVNNTNSPHAVFRSLPLKAARVTGGFWESRQAVNRSASLKTGYQRLEDAGNFHNLRLAAGLVKGDYRGPLFMDSDIYKWLEAVGYDLALYPDGELERMSKSVIELLGAAQAPDGYLDSYYQVVKPEERWQNLDNGHEMYCAGHLIQAAVAFHRAVGDEQLLGIAQRIADHIDATFGPDKRSGVCGHPEIEMALVELYRETGVKRYLILAGFLIDQRGQQRMRGFGYYGSEYYQDRVPVRLAEVVEGHAVRQLYLTSGATDYAMETGDPALMAAMGRLWRDLTSRKAYITGGFGARFEGEAFGEAYELPNDRAYAESCASIAGFMWNWRMLLASGDARYADWMERSLYNGALSGVSLDGLRYFYVNPLLSRGGTGRVEWFGCACCPPNLMRLVALIGNFAFTQDAQGIQVSHYMSAQVKVEHPSAGNVELSMETAYPHEGHVRMVVEKGGRGVWALSLRIPAWCREAALRLNGQPETTVLTPGKYAVVQRVWQTGDVVELDLPMRPRLTVPNPRLDAARGCVAIERGPLVYCLEDADQAPGANMLDVSIDPAEPLGDAWRSDLLGGVHTVEARGFIFESKDREETLYRPREESGAVYRSAPLTAIPYYAWNNRGNGAMRVWIPAL